MTQPALRPQTRGRSRQESLITPHFSGATVRWQERAYHLAGQQLRRYVAEEPLLHVRADRQALMAPLIPPPNGPCL